MLRWSFNLQIYFLNTRFNQILEIKNPIKQLCRTGQFMKMLYFAPNLHSMGLMSTRDFENYSSLFKLMSSLISPPDLLLYLRASVPTLVNQIQTRGREYESSIRIDYLKRLNERYEAWIETYDLGKLLIIRADHYNFPNNKDHLSEVIDKINAELHGLF